MDLIIAQGLFFLARYLFSSPVIEKAGSYPQCRFYAEQTLAYQPGDGFLVNAFQARANLFQTQPSSRTIFPLCPPYEFFSFLSIV